MESDAEQHLQGVVDVRQTRCIDGHTQMCRNTDIKGLRDGASCDVGKKCIGDSTANALTHGAAVMSESEDECKENCANKVTEFSSLGTVSEQSTLMVDKVPQSCLDEQSHNIAECVNDIDCDARSALADSYIDYVELDDILDAARTGDLVDNAVITGEASVDMPDKNDSNCVAITNENRCKSELVHVSLEHNAMVDSNVSSQVANTDLVGTVCTGLNAKVCNAAAMQHSQNSVSPRPSVSLNTDKNTSVDLEEVSYDVWLKTCTNNTVANDESSAVIEHVSSGDHEDVHNNCTDSFFTGRTVPIAPSDEQHSHTEAVHMASSSRGMVAECAVDSSSAKASKMKASKQGRARLSLSQPGRSMQPLTHFFQLLSSACTKNCSTDTVPNDAVILENAGSSSERSESGRMSCESSIVNCDVTSLSNQCSATDKSSIANADRKENVPEAVALEHCDSRVVGSDMNVTSIVSATAGDNKSVSSSDVVLRKTPKARKSCQVRYNENFNLSSSDKRVVGTGGMPMTFKLPDLESALGIKRKSLDTLDAKTLDRIMLAKAQENQRKSGLACKGTVASHKTEDIMKGGNDTLSVINDLTSVAKSATSPAKLSPGNTEQTLPTSKSHIEHEPSFNSSMCDNTVTNEKTSQTEAENSPCRASNKMTISSDIIPESSYNKDGASCSPRFNGSFLSKASNLVEKSAQDTLIGVEGSVTNKENETGKESCDDSLVLASASLDVKMRHYSDFCDNSGTDRQRKLAEDSCEQQSIVSDALDTVTTKSCSADSRHLENPMSVSENIEPSDLQPCVEHFRKGVLHAVKDKVKKRKKKKVPTATLR